MRLSNDEYFKDFKIFDLTWIWLIWLEWPVYKRGNTEFFLNGGSSRECDHDCEQLGDLYRVYISYISESMHCLHWGKSVNVKWIKKLFFFIFFSKAFTDLRKQPVLGLGIFSAHHWVMIFKFVVKSLILELWNCMSNLVQQLLFCLIHHPLEHVKT